MMLLADRGAVTAVDAAGVIGQPHNGTLPAGNVSAMFTVQNVVAPATLSVRAAIEFSTDGGNLWHQLVRFVDLAAAGGRLARFPLNTAAAESVLTPADMTVVAAAAVLSDGGVGDVMWRAQTRVATLTGASASVNVIVGLGVVDQGETD